MRTSSRKRLVLAAMLLAGPLPALSQRLEPDSQAATVVSVRRDAVLPARSVLRTIDDPSTGARWLLVPDPAHPEGPGRLVLSASAPAGKESAGFGGSSREAHSPSGKSQRFKIHAGDALLVEEHTAVVDSRLEAVALSSAASGEELRARLRIGGKVVRAIALGRGRAALVCEGGARR